MDNLYRLKMDLESLKIDHSLFTNKSLLITGGTGSFGRALTEYLLTYCPSIRRLVIFSRDEQKQFEMAQIYSPDKYPQIRYFIGDVRDRDRLRRAFDGIDFVIHAAAMKHVHIAEYNPDECVKTNIGGAENVIHAALSAKVSRVVALSTDKACAPVNLYGATKLASDKLFIAANNFKGKADLRLSVVRYGNVLGSNGSVIPFFIKKKKSGVLPITNPNMTRFNITLKAGVKMVLFALERALGGELFVPKIPSYKITDVAQAIGPDCKKEIIGPRPGEKVHEEMISPSDAPNTYELKNYFIILPKDNDPKYMGYLNTEGAKKVPEGFHYRSDNNTNWENVESLRKLIKDYCDEKETDAPKTFSLDNILNGRGLFVYSDPGGAKPILSLASDKEINKSESIIISDREYQFASSFSIKPKKPSLEPKIDFETIKPDFVFTGISYSSKIELDYIEQANKLNIPSYAYVDHWVNIRPRFLKNGAEVLPQMIFVPDIRAKELAISEGLPSNIIHIIDNPYHRYLKTWQPTKNKEKTLEEFGIQADDRPLCLYMPDPLSNLEINKCHGFDEISATNELIHCLGEDSEKFQLVLVPHPNQNINKFTENTKKMFKIIPPGKDLNELIYYSDCVIGFFSNLLIESQILNQTVIRFLPNDINDLLKHKNIGTVVNQKTILSHLNQSLLNITP